MRLKVLIVDFETPRWLRKTLSYALPASIVLGIGSVVFATPPQQFSSGAVLHATDLNTLSVVKNGGVSYSVGATTYCGTGPTTITGAISYSGATGYLGGKAMCAASSGCGTSPTAHMCTMEEVIRSASLGLTIADGWINGATGMEAAEVSGSGSYYDSDCQGWTSSVTQQYGTLWTSTGVNVTNCGGNSGYPVLCCD